MGENAICGFPRRDERTKLVFCDWDSNKNKNKHKFRLLSKNRIP